MTEPNVSLQEYLTSLINGAEKRADERFEAMRETVSTAFRSAQIAIDKADEATGKRFESVNEFRAQLADQAQQFATRQELGALADKLTVQIDQARNDLDTLAKRVDMREGQTIGSRITGGVLVTVLTVGVAMIGLIFVAANYFAR